jgi:signal transduction histidine kinase
MKGQNTNRILMYTLIAMIAIATYITINSYYTQLSIYEEKEIFKLDCIANAVAYRISGDEYVGLIERYPSSQSETSVMNDTTYKKIAMQLNGAVKMTQIPSEIHAVIKDKETQKFKLTVATGGKKWLEELSGPSPLDTLYNKGGMIGRFKTSDGTPNIGAVSVIRNSNMEPVGVLQVNETFASFIQKSKNQIYFNIILTLIFITVIGILMFFSVRNILNRQTKLALERQELEKMRSELMANVSHDIRTPLASIHGYVETMLMKKDSMDKDQTEKYLQTTLQSTEKLKNMVDELFELSKLESRERELKLETFDIAELMQDTCAGFQVVANEKGVKIECAVPNSSNKVHADIALIDRVIQNLVSNAVKHSSAGDTVFLSASAANDKVRIQVKDTGSGITPEDLPHIFNRFHKGKSSQPGTGLGLAIVKRILELHSSKCFVESIPKKETTFWFDLKKA